MADSLLAPFDRDDAPGVVVGIIQNGELHYRGGVGLANLSHRISLTPSTRINVGSTAKTLTGYALARLALDGALGLDDDVRLYLPELPDLGATVTLRHLATHTSGYREFLNALAVGGWRIEDGDHIPEVEVFRVVQNQPALQNPPGAEWNYNNTGYLLLARVIERVTGRPFPEWIRDEVFVPLGMDASTFRTHPSEVVPESAYGYTPRGSEVRGWRQARDVGPAIGAGSLYTTVEDLSRWMLALTGDDPRWAEPFALMTEVFVLNDGTPTTYGLGIEVDREGELRRIHHPGGDTGHRAHFAWFPERRAGVIVVGNRSDLAGDLPGRLTRAFLGDPGTSPGSREDESATTEDDPASAGQGTQPPAPEIDPALLARMVGSYALQVQPDFVLSIRKEGRTLVAQASGQPPFPLTPMSNHEFALEAVGARVEFLFDGGDELPATALVVHQGGGRFPAPRVTEREEGVDLIPYEGRYHSREFDTFYDVVRDGDGLRLEHRRRDPVTVAPAGPDRFSGPFPFFEVTFQRDEEGLITGFLANAIRARDMLFEKSP